MIHYYTDEVGKLVHDSSSGRPLHGSHMWKFLELPRNLVREYMEVCKTLLNERNLSRGEQKQIEQSVHTVKEKIASPDDQQIFGHEDGGKWEIIDLIFANVRAEPPTAVHPHQRGIRRKSV
jgi:hypothetical protein